ncbi:MAG TPA: hypothetical protein VMT18_05500 [Planctomycetota bacterium]|nr:hypothetical protein [Planctomycetota bacterium]
MLRDNHGPGWLIGLALVLVVGATFWLRSSTTPPAAVVPMLDRGVSPPERSTDPQREPGSAPLSVAMSSSERVALDESQTPLHLRLVAWPRSRPLTRCFVDARVDDKTSSHAVGDDALLVLDRPRLGATLVLEVEGFRETSVEPDSLRSVAEVEVTMHPLRGLFGRVVDRDGRAVPGAHVSASKDSFELVRASLSGDSARADLGRRARVLATDQTDADGWYALDVTTDQVRGPLHLRGYLDVDHSAARDVVLPRPDGALEDLVLAPLPRIEVSVVDEGGAPIRGVMFWPNLPRSAIDAGEPSEWTTGPDGTCRVPVLRLPDLLFPHGIACIPIERRIDGVAVASNVELERSEQRLEWVVRIVDSVHLFVRDGITGETVVQPSLELAAYAGAERVATLSWINSGASGAYVYGFHGEGEDSQTLARAPAYDRLVLDVHDPAYERIEGRVLTRAQLPPGGEHTLVLQPLGTAYALTGQVLDEGGSPLPGMTVRAVGVAAGPLQPGRSRGSTSEWSDAEGRFLLSWSTDTPGLSVLVYCSDPRTGRFGRLGPLDPTRAQDLELRVTAAMSVPFVLESDSPDSAIHVRVTPLDLGDPLPIYGAEVRTQRNADGTRRGVLRLPAGERVSVYAYLRSEARQMHTRPGGVEFDPASPVLPLRLSVTRTSIRLSGRVLGPDMDAVRGCLVVAVERDAKSSSSDSHVLGTLDGDAFHCDVQKPGPWSLLLVEPDGTVVVGRLDLDVVGDREGLVLAPSGR